MKYVFITIWLLGVLGFNILHSEIGNHSPLCELQHYLRAAIWGVLMLLAHDKYQRYAADREELKYGKDH